VTKEKKFYNIDTRPLPLLSTDVDADRCCFLPDFSGALSLSFWLGVDDLRLLSILNWLLVRSVPGNGFDHFFKLLFFLSPLTFLIILRRNLGRPKRRLVSGVFAVTKRTSLAQKIIRRVVALTQNAHKRSGGRTNTLKTFCIKLKK
jgi:hypothetical protein